MPSDLRSVAAYAPMKRGLKATHVAAYAEKGTASSAAYAPILKVTTVAAYAPMKRGLKVSRRRQNHTKIVGCSLCPDEKGTESLLRDREGWAPGRVAAYAPMKRGLKVK